MARKPDGLGKEKYGSRAEGDERERQRLLKTARGIGGDGTRSIKVYGTEPRICRGRVLARRLWQPDRARPGSRRRDVLDLAPAVVDVLLSAKRVGATGKEYGPT